ncbi:FAD-dependent oxidoreductase, partial [Psychrobacter sp. T6-1]|uniref:FAD-dependent oxidoreductase n=1 Tax=Psychrobacter sp. T6-1 TaxID=3457447 RepID=UPI003FD2AC82
LAAKNNSAAVLEPTGALDLLLKANIDVAQIADYPDTMATTLPDEQARQLSHLTMQDLSDNLYLPQSGLVNPQALKDVIMSHPFISYQQLNVNEINENNEQVYVSGYRDGEQINLQADNVVICAAFESHALDTRIFDCRKIRGQLSWFIPSAEQLAKLPKIPLKYSGYCTLFTAQAGDAQINNVVEGQPYLLLGASFVRNDIATDIRAGEHQISRDKLIKAIAEMNEVIPADTSKWQARASVRTQTPDYHPIVGQLPDSTRLWTLTAMGAKGYAFAPICAEALADMMLGDFMPLSSALLDRLAPNRIRLQTPLNE